MTASHSGLARRLKIETAALHAQAERAGVMRDLLRGRLERGAYVGLLGNLLAIYTGLEAALDRQAAHPFVAALNLPQLRRRPALAADLRTLSGEGWDRIGLAKTTVAYASRLAALGDERPHLLVAHAYVRYLGDLSGGQILRSIVAKALRLVDGAGTTFYDFGADPGALAVALRRDLDALDAVGPAADDIVAEAQHAFRLHIGLFEELAAAPRELGQSPLV